jgi:proteic killer suppression protein
MLRNHAVFQNFHAHHLSGIDRHEREQWRGHPFFDWTAEFVKLYDQATCDPHYPSEPIETFIPMIESFKHKGLKELFEKGSSAKIQKALAERAIRRLDAIDIAKVPEALDVPGFDFHGLQGKPTRYSVHVNGPWCITFEWHGENAIKVDFENYH